eukprot:COSAG01_NODE_497_length_16267_cov_5.357558_25_plen_127_part_00
MVLCCRSSSTNARRTALHHRAPAPRPPVRQLEPLHLLLRAHGGHLRADIPVKSSKRCFILNALTLSEVGPGPQRPCSRTLLLGQARCLRPVLEDDHYLPVTRYHTSICVAPQFCGPPHAALILLPV